MAKATHTRSVRQDIEAELGRPLSEAGWTHLKDFGVELDVEEGLVTPAEMAKRVRALSEVPTRRRQASDDHSTESIPGAAALGLRGEAISAWMIRAAHRDSLVVNFRRDHLKHGILAESEVGDWIRERYRAAVSGWLDLGEPVPGWSQLKAIRAAERSGRRFVTLEWAEPTADGWQSGRWPVPVSSVPGRLAKVSQRLSSRFLWTLPEATLFVLADFFPFTSPISATSSVGLRFDVEAGGSFDILSRVAITVDPVVTPEQLAGYWRGIRKRMLTRRYTPLSEKHLRLAEFMAERDHSSTWDEDRRAWNHRHLERPDWHYHDRRLFHRDARLAIERLLRTGVQSPSAHE